MSIVGLFLFMLYFGAFSVGASMGLVLAVRDGDPFYIVIAGVLLIVCTPASWLAAMVLGSRVERTWPPN